MKELDKITYSDMKKEFVSKKDIENIVLELSEIKKILQSMQDKVSNNYEDEETKIKIVRKKIII